MTVMFVQTSILFIKIQLCQVQLINSDGKNTDVKIFDISAANLRFHIWKYIS
jgi:hypothetical protein